eukprot:TRINITY_DN4396_c2_g3_i1.p1 TRINITY_DN4396_c2_g3~~TRINITY_DN4396_c2_g3_i1.p1  ORF type:complete len:648 (-),score=108.10 TRINITY_DN4396_c2_g3_i1:491-2434(-)
MGCATSQPVRAESEQIQPSQDVEPSPQREPRSSSFGKVAAAAAAAAASCCPAWLAIDPTGDDVEGAADSSGRAPCARRSLSSKSDLSIIVTKPTLLFLGANSTQGSIFPPGAEIFLGEKLSPGAIGSPATPKSSPGGPTSPNDSPTALDPAQEFTLDEMHEATDEFHEDFVLGEGGNGKVYEGWLHVKDNAHSGQTKLCQVAIKKLHPESELGFKEWLSEVISMRRLHHPHLVHLVGYCSSEGEDLLVYEYMENGSLDCHLFQASMPPLSWETRLKIASESAEGLAYLHGGMDPPVIFHDLKSGNILLDKDFSPKLSDFGLAKACPHSEVREVTDIAGIPLYLFCNWTFTAPEYIPTAKSDVYAFGVCLLELLTGRRAFDTCRAWEERRLVDWALPQLTDRNLVAKIVDPRLEGKFPLRAAYKFAQTAAWCLTDSKVRPTMNDVVRILKGLQEMSHLLMKWAVTMLSHLPASDVTAEELAEILAETLEGGDACRDVREGDVAEARGGNVVCGRERNGGEGGANTLPSGAALGQPALDGRGSPSRKAEEMEDSLRVGGAGAGSRGGTEMRGGGEWGREGRGNAAQGSEGGGGDKGGEALGRDEVADLRKHLLMHIGEEDETRKGESPRDAKRRGERGLRVGACKVGLD